MFRPQISTTVRLTLGLTSLTALALLLSYTIGIFPNTRQTIIQSRASLCESLAIHFSLLAAKGETGLMEASLRAMAARNLDIQSVAVRRTSGDLQLQIGNHAKLWQPRADGLSTDSQMYVPIFCSSEAWGMVRLEVVPPLP